MRASAGGKELVEVNCANTSACIWKEVVVGAASNTHGWGSCTPPAGEFKACIEPSYLIAYTLWI
jgi:hypothetical protein